MLTFTDLDVLGKEVHHKPFVSSPRREMMEKRRDL